MSEYDETHGINRKPAGAAESAGGRFDNRDRLEAEGVELTGGTVVDNVPAADDWMARYANEMPFYLSVAEHRPPNPGESMIGSTRTADAIAFTMAYSPGWDADTLENVADIIGDSGRPHPGDYYGSVEYDDAGTPTNPDYEKALAQWSLDHVPAHSQEVKDFLAVNEIAKNLAATEQWGPDDNDFTGYQIRETGRPAFTADPDVYVHQLERWNRDQGLMPSSNIDRVADLAEDAGQPTLGHLLTSLAYAGKISADNLTGITGEELEALYDTRLAKPVQDTVADITARSANFGWEAVETRAPLSEAFFEHIIQMGIDSGQWGDRAPILTHADKVALSAAHLRPGVDALIGDVQTGRYR